LLENVDIYFGESYFIALALISEAECFETQAILRAQLSNLVTTEAPFKQFLGIASYAQSLYKKANGLLLGIPNTDSLRTFIQQRLNNITGALLYVNAAHIADDNPSQALKDVTEALSYSKKSDLLEPGTVQNLLQSLL